jgi:hypothetical protein
VPGRKGLLWIGAVGTAAIIVAAANYRSSVAFRARHYFSISWTHRVNPDSIRDGVTQVVPLGTPISQVGAALGKAGIGSDGLSGYYTLPGGSDGVIRLEYDHHHFALVQSHYGIFLHFEGGLLREVRVEPWFTGL